MASPSTSPMMTAARPMTMAPRPMLMSAKPWYWDMRPPERATRPLDRLRPSTFMVDVDALARAMSGLEPVARMAEPCSVPKNQYSTAMMHAAAKMAPTRIAGTVRESSRR